MSGNFYFETLWNRPRLVHYILLFQIPEFLYDSSFHYITAVLYLLEIKKSQCLLSASITYNFPVMVEALLETIPPIWFDRNIDNLAENQILLVYPVATFNKTCFRWIVAHALQFLPVPALVTQTFFLPTVSSEFIYHFTVKIS